MDAAIDAVFADILQRYPEKTIDRDSAWSAIRSVLHQPEARRLKFLAESSASNPSALALLQEYGQEILDRMNPGFLFLMHQNTIRPVNRPELLEVYCYEERTYLALSERHLATGSENVIAKAELLRFSYLPKPAKNVDIETVCNDWSCDIKVVQEFIDQNFVAKEHREQVDVFQENRFNFLFYDAMGYFTHASPPATEVPQFVVRKPCLFARDNSEPDEEDEDF